ncbi:MAG: IreB family regulatory phosphoprotein [Ruminococcaceae bacterium]|nr:IreB family regulatory phosphoprotein [Oscillospiraceae bacterium]
MISVPEGEIDQKQLLFDICEAIREGGYDPVSQIVGYIISEDPTHITNYKNARTLIGKLERDELLKQMVQSYIDSVADEIDSRNLRK